MKHAPMGPVKARPVNGQTHEPARCTAHSSRTGEPCKRAPILGGTVCATHGGRAPQVKAKAAERLKALAPKAVSTLEALLERAEFPTVQLGAAKYVYDQAEGTAVDRVEQKVTGALVIRCELTD